MIGGVCAGSQSVFPPALTEETRFTWLYGSVPFGSGRGLWLVLQITKIGLFPIVPFPFLFFPSGIGLMVRLL
jgi:hypothetical protein